MRQYIYSTLLVLPLILTSGCTEKGHSAEQTAADRSAAVISTPAELPKEEPKPRAEPASQPENASAPVVDKGSDSCPTICQRSRELKCSIGPDDCLTACKAMQDVPVCKAEMQQVVACMLTKPPKDWECSEEGIAAIKDGVCDEEQRRFMMCITK